MNQLFWVWYVLIAGVDHKHNDTMDMLRDRLRIQPLFRIRLDKAVEECRGQWLGRDDGGRDDQSVLGLGNDAFSDQHCP